MSWQDLLAALDRAQIMEEFIPTSGNKEGRGRFVGVGSDEQSFG